MKESLNKVVVFFGGKSVEREISVITGIQVIKNINPIKNKVFPVYINEMGEWLYAEELKEIKSFKNLNKIKLKKVCLIPNSKTLYWNKKGKLKTITDVDVVINCCHGTGGEDGSLAGCLNFSGLAHISPGVLACSVSMNKQASKVFFKGLGLNVLDSFVFSKEQLKLSWQNIKEKIDKIGFPLVVKPCSLGSSIGVRFCKNLDEVLNASNIAFEFDEKVIVEKGLERFDELFCSAFSKNREIFVSELEKNSTNMMLDFDEKYLTNKKRNFPAKTSKYIKKEVQNATKKIYENLNCSGIIRVDFLFDKITKKLFVNEANVIPGSLAMGFWNKKFEMSDLFDDLMEDARINFENRNKLKFNYSSNVLENFEVSAKNKLK